MWPIADCLGFLILKSAVCTFNSFFLISYMKPGSVKAKIKDVAIDKPGSKWMIFFGIAKRIAKRALSKHSLIWWAVACTSTAELFIFPISYMPT